MRAGLAAGSQLGQRAQVNRSRQVFSRPRRGDRGHIHEALRLSPRDIFAFRWMMWVGIAKVQLNADGEAVAWLRRSIETNRNVPLAHFYLAVALAQLGLLDEARATAQAGLRLDSGSTIRRFRAGAASDNPKFIAGRERMYEGMRRLGYRRARLMSATSHLRLVAVKLDQVEGIQHRLMAPAASRVAGNHDLAIDQERLRLEASGGSDNSQEAVWPNHVRCA